MGQLFLDDLGQTKWVQLRPESLISLELLAVDRFGCRLKLRQSVEGSLRAIIETANPGAFADRLDKLHDG